MPYISISTTLSLNQTMRESVKAGLGEIISILPNKTEKLLMVDFSEGHTMFLAGEEKKSCAFMDVKIYGSASYAAKAEFTAAAFLILEEKLGLKESEIYIAIAEYPTWGTGGKMK
ncbi:hypothetical protein [Caproiciproducens sp.]